jgi:hypothetical protein
LVKLEEIVDINGTNTCAIIPPPGEKCGPVLFFIEIPPRLIEEMQIITIL